MELSSLPFRFFLAVVILLLAIDRSPNGEPADCDCPQIPPLNLTINPPRGCYNIGDHYRYTCIDGYRRKAGTSNLIQCKREGGIGKWVKRSKPLECISDPTRPPSTPQPNQTVSVQPTTLTPLSPSNATAKSQGGGSSNSTSQDVPSDHINGTQRQGNQTDVNQTSTGHGTTAAAIISIVAVLALIGLALYFYTRRAGRRNSEAPREDDHDVQIRLQDGEDKI